MLYKHLSIHIVTSYKWSCNKCTFKFNSKEELISHSNIHSYRLVSKYLKRVPYVDGTDFSSIDIADESKDVTDYSLVKPETHYNVYQELSDRMIGNLIMFKELNGDYIREMILNGIISHNASMFIQIQMSKFARKKPVELLISIDDIDQKILSRTDDYPLIKKIDLKCNICKLPIENFDQHYSPTMLECKGTCVYKTNCYAAMNIHREMQYKNSCDNLFFDGHSEIPRFADITEEQLKQAAEYNGTYNLAEEIEDIKNDFPDDPSPYYVVCCKKCCTIFPTLKDAGKHLFLFSKFISLINFSNFSISTSSIYVY